MPFAYYSEFLPAVPFPHLHTNVCSPRWCWALCCEAPCSEASFRGRFLSTRRLQFLKMMVPFTRGWAGNLCADHHRNLQIHHLVKPFPYCISQAASENANKGWEKVGENGVSVLHGTSADSTPSHPRPFLASAPASPLSALSPGRAVISVLWRRGCCSVQPGL